jgi:hypothetical protein
VKKRETDRRNNRISEYDLLGSHNVWAYHSIAVTDQKTITWLNIPGETLKLIHKIY